MEINICFATNDRYAPHAAALIASIMENKLPEDELSFHFFSDKTSPAVQNVFRQMSRQLGFQLTIYEMSDEQFADFPIFQGSRTPYFRLSMHRFLPATLDKIVYLDCDMIVTTSLSELFSIDISGHYAAVVAEALKVPHLPIEYPYFNSGMMILNLGKYRNENMEEVAIKFGHEHPDWVLFADQCILNYIFKGNVICLPLKWNMVFSHHDFEKILLSNGREPYPHTEYEIHEAVTNPSIIHYVWKPKPWQHDCTHPKKVFYWKYAKKTPFYKQVRYEYYKASTIHLLRTMPQTLPTVVMQAVKWPERMLRRGIIKPLKAFLGVKKQTQRQ